MREGVLLVFIARFTASALALRFPDRRYRAVGAGQHIGGAKRGFQRQFVIEDVFAGGVIQILGELDIKVQYVPIRYRNDAVPPDVDIILELFLHVRMMHDTAALYS